MKKTFLMAALAMGLCLSSCTEKIEAPVYSDKPVTNVELQEILKAEGVNFNEAGCILLDDAAKAITSLDLSGKKIEDLSELAVLPNLTDLTLEGYGPAFDFSILPAQITGVDLTKNEITEFNNLIKVEIEENGDETITNLRDIKKLYLPEAAKYNTTDLIRFHRQNKTAIENGDVDMQIADAEGKLAKYTTLRTISDPVLSAYLNKQFSSIFTDGKLDLSKRLNNDQKLTIIQLNANGVENFADLKSMEGVQYIINNLYWEGTMITIQMDEPKDLPAIKVPASVTQIYLVKVNAKGFDLSAAENLLNLSMQEVNGVETVDLRGSKVWGQRDLETEDSSAATQLEVLGCNDVKSIIFPEAEVLRAYRLDIEALPALATCDLSKFSYFHNLNIGDLPDSYNLVYPNVTEFTAPVVGVPGPPKDVLLFGCTTKTYGLQATKDFINKYKKYDNRNRIMRGRTKFQPYHSWR